MNNNHVSRSAHTAAATTAAATTSAAAATVAKLTVGALAIALAATACTPASAQNAESAATESAASNVAKGPLTEMLKGVLGLNLTPAEQERQWADQTRHQEEMIAQCMSQAGFEYIPNVPSGDSNAEQMIRFDDREWVAQFGFAVTRTPWDTPEAQATAHVDPNAAYQDSLSPAELAAFNDALWGSMLDINYVGSESAADIEAMLANGGCWGAAQQATAEESAAGMLFAAEFAPISDAIMTFFNDQQQQITEVDRDWVACMADAGHAQFQRQADAQNSINAAQEEILGSLNWEAWDMDAKGYPNPANHDELAKLAEREINVALADFDCRQSTNFAARQSVFQVEAEKQFVNDHKVELEALRSAAEQRS